MSVAAGPDTNIAVFQRVLWEIPVFVTKRFSKYVDGCLMPSGSNVINLNRTIASRPADQTEYCGNFVVMIPDFAYKSF